MVRFSCFNARIHSSTPKKTVQLSAEVMHKALEDQSDNPGSKDFTNSSGTSPLLLKAHDDILCISANKVTRSSSVEHSWKSDKIKMKYNTESDVEVNKTRIKKSQSLGSGLDRKGRVSGGNDSEDETDQGFSGDGSHDQSGSVISVGDKDPEVIFGQSPEALLSVSLQVSSDMVNNESIFSIGDLQQPEKGGCENSNAQFSGECTGESSNHTPRTTHTPHAISKSFSLPNIVSFGGLLTSVKIVPRSSSCEDLNVLDLKRKEMLVHNVSTLVNLKQQRERTPVASRRDRHREITPSSRMPVSHQQDVRRPSYEEAHPARERQGQYHPQGHMRTDNTGPIGLLNRRQL